MDVDREPGLVISTIYLESAAFRQRAEAEALPSSATANAGDIGVSVEIGIRSDLGAGFIRLTVKSERSKTPDAPPQVYDLQVSMVGYVQRDEKAPNLEISTFLQTSGVNMMFPFVREAVANLTGRGRFGALWIAPLNTAKIARELQASGPASPPAPLRTPPPPPSRGTPVSATVDLLRERDRQQRIAERKSGIRKK